MFIVCAISTLPTTWLLFCGITNLQMICKYYIACLRLNIISLYCLILSYLFLNFVWSIQWKRNKRWVPHCQAFDKAGYYRIGKVIASEEWDLNKNLTHLVQGNRIVIFLKHLWRVDVLTLSTEYIYCYQIWKKTIIAFSS